MSWQKLILDFAGRIKCEPADQNVFDIHGGGLDLIFPHHENEIAQSCCAFGSKRMANVWMHNGFLQVEGEKMSKSLGNFVTINELLETEKFGGRKWPGEVLRLAMLMTHYRQPIDWTSKTLSEATQILQRWYNDVLQDDPLSLGETQPDGEFVSALLDDLNMPRAIARLHALYSATKGPASGPFQLDAKRVFVRSANLLGLLNYSKADWFSARLRSEGFFQNTSLDVAKINALRDARLAARKAKNWAESDRIRDELAAMGIQLMDGKDPATGEPTTTWEVKR